MHSGSPQPPPPCLSVPALCPSPSPTLRWKLPRQHRFPPTRPPLAPSNQRRTRPARERCVCPARLTESGLSSPVPSLARNYSLSQPTSAAMSSTPLPKTPAFGTHSTASSQAGVVCVWTNTWSGTEVQTPRLPRSALPERTWVLPTRKSSHTNAPIFQPTRAAKNYPRRRRFTWNVA